MSRRNSILLILVFVTVGGVGGYFAVRSFLTEPPGPEPTTKPAGPTDAATVGTTGKLVVLVVFDQFRGDYIDRWATAFAPDGFERLKRDGVWYANAHIPYACTSTAPGHASIATGTTPSIHGIVENAWIERSPAAKGEGKLTYCVQPSREFALIPSLVLGRGEVPGRAERGSDLGFSPENLLAPTVSDAFRSSGQGKVVSLSIKDRAAVLMGGKSAGKSPPLVYCFDTRDGRFHTDAYYTDGLPQWVRDFNDHRETFDFWKGKDWTVLRHDLNYNALAGPDSASGEDYGVNQGQIFPHPMNSKAPNGGPEYYRALETSPFGNDVLLAFARAAIAGEGLGSRGTTDLLCLSFSSNDLVGHRWGPDSWEVLDTTLRSDLIVRDLLAYLDSRLGKDRYTVVLTADHGVCPLPEQSVQTKYPTASRGQKPEEMLKDLAVALDSAFPPAERPGQWFLAYDSVSEVWPWVYLNRDEIVKRNVSYDSVVKFATDWLGGRGYTLTAFSRHNIETRTVPLTLTDEQKKLAEAILPQVILSYQPERCGDIIVIPQKGVQLSKFNAGTGHGSPWPYDTWVPIVAYGAGIPVLGRKDERVSSLLVAPLVSKALGIAPPARAAEKLPAEIAK